MCDTTAPPYRKSFSNCKYSEARKEKEKKQVAENKGFTQKRRSPKYNERRKIKYDNCYFYFLNIYIIPHSLPLTGKFLPFLKQSFCMKRVEKCITL